MPYSLFECKPVLYTFECKFVSVTERRRFMNKKLRDALNYQINKEFYSAYLYLSMAAYCDSIPLAGFAHWLKVQFQE